MNFRTHIVDPRWETSPTSLALRCVGCSYLLPMSTLERLCRIQAHHIDHNCRTGALEMRFHEAAEGEPFLAGSARALILDGLSDDDLRRECERRRLTIKGLIAGAAKVAGPEAATRPLSESSPLLSVERGLGINALPMKRQDNSVAFLDEDLLCADE